MPYAAATLPVSTPASIGGAPYLGTGPLQPPSSAAPLTAAAPNANTAARPRRCVIARRGSAGGAKAAPQNGHAASVRRTWREQDEQGASVVMAAVLRRG